MVRHLILLSSLFLSLSLWANPIPTLPKQYESAVQTAFENLNKQGFKVVSLAFVNTDGNTIMFRAEVDLGITGKTSSLTIQVPTTIGGAEVAPDNFQDVLENKIESKLKMIVLIGTDGQIIDHMTLLELLIKDTKEIHKVLFSGPEPKKLPVPDPKGSPAEATRILNLNASAVKRVDDRKSINTLLKMLQQVELAMRSQPLKYYGEGIPDTVAKAFEHAELTFKQFDKSIHTVEGVVVSSVYIKRAVNQVAELHAQLEKTTTLGDHAFDKHSKTLASIAVFLEVERKKIEAETKRLKEGGDKAFESVEATQLQERSLRLMLLDYEANKLQERVARLRGAK